MDSFMDKIAQKFTAQDMIKANSAAEEKEMKRLRMQVAEYDQRLQEMRKLNLKNLELADQLQAFIEQGKSRMQELGASSGKNSAEDLKALGQEIASVQNGMVRNIQANLNAQNAQLQKILSEQNTGIQEVQKVLSEQNAGIQDMHKGLSAQNDGVRNIREVLAAQQELVQSVQNVIDTQGQDIKNLQTALDSQTDRMNELTNQLMDHIHKEDVKVYRNVQAAVSDENKALLSELSRQSGSQTPVVVLTAITLIASLANIGFWIAKLLGVF